MVRPPGGQYFWAWNTGFLFDDADVCYSATMLDKTSDPTLSYGGLMFWVADNDNFYTFITASNGYFKVGRYVSGNWVTDPIGWTVSPALKQGPNVTNSVRLKFEGTSGHRRNQRHQGRLVQGSASGQAERHRLHRWLRSTA